jgi:hypothetical protein
MGLWRHSSQLLGRNGTRRSADYSPALLLNDLQLLLPQLLL